MELISFFEWMETSALGQIGKTYGGVYALGQSLHLMSLALLGGTVLVTDLRLLNVLLRDVPSEVVVESTHKWFKVAVSLMIATGIFMAAAVALRMYYNAFFWAKMTALATGIAFVFFVKYPLLQRKHDSINPVVLKSLAVASILLWFSVAATGRWIGFS
ncbi:MAG: hypothetical protein Q8L60_14810 [Gammaproteobacteria bacterium]|nr:hypothetical protein [Gammaproteobacteria bacterium]MDP2142229.1 hypothetical protein [Gammaproteobacteria bacterium]MDP2347878.1 hypothetical protein [Gammaproteobacteria bacterium]